MKSDVEYPSLWDIRRCLLSSVILRKILHSAILNMPRPSLVSRKKFGSSKRS